MIDRAIAFLLLGLAVLLLRVSRAPMVAEQLMRRGFLLLPLSLLPCEKRAANVSADLNLEAVFCVASLSGIFGVKSFLDALSFGVGRRRDFKLKPRDGGF